MVLLKLCGVSCKDTATTTTTSSESGKRELRALSFRVCEGGGGNMYLPFLLLIVADLPAATAFFLPARRPVTSNMRMNNSSAGTAATMSSVIKVSKGIGDGRGMDGGGFGLLRRVFG